MTTYFTSTQRSILKYAWIPVILTIIIYSGVDYLLRHFYTSGQGDSIRPWLLVAYYLPLIGTIGYDMLMRKNVLHFILILLAALCMNGCMFWINNSPHLFKPAVVMGFWFNCLHLTLYFLVFLARAYLLKLKRPWLAGLLAMIVGWYVAPLGNGIYYLNEKFHFDFFTEEIISLPFRGIYPLALLIVLALADNFANMEGYIDKLRSKVQIIDAKEYLLLYFVTSWTCFFGAVLMGREFNSFVQRLTLRYDGAVYNMSSPYVELTTFIIVMLCCIAAGYLLRNILISRMSTIGSSNGWLYVLHYSFLLNIIPVIIWGGAKKMHETIEENVQFYLSKEPSSVGIAIMWLGCGGGLVLGIALASNYLGFAIPVLVAALLHGMLRHSRAALDFIIVINAGILIYSFPGIHRDIEGAIMMMALMSVYLSVYVLMEVFHPRLRGKDAIPVELLSL